MQENEYEKLKEKMWISYQKIGSVVCPALDSTRVHFTRTGFRHLIRRKRKFRPLKDQFRRFKLLPLAKEVLLDGHLTHRYQEGRVIFWEITKYMSKKKIMVVVCEDGNNPIYFLSIMDK